MREKRYITEGYCALGQVRRRRNLCECYDGVGKKVFDVSPTKNPSSILTTMTATMTSYTKPPSGGTTDALDLIEWAKGIPYHASIHGLHSAIRYYTKPRQDGQDLLRIRWSGQSVRPLWVPELWEYRNRHFRQSQNPEITDWTPEGAYGFKGYAATEFMQYLDGNLQYPTLYGYVADSHLREVPGYQEPLVVMVYKEKRLLA